MSEGFWLRLGAGAACTSVRFLHDPQVVADAWQVLRTRMIRERDPAFTRMEWAYLLHFLDRERLQNVWEQGFGEAAAGAAAELPRKIAIARGRVALWLPNNVSLLGVLTLVLISLTGAQVRVKTGSRSEDLCAPFLAYAGAMAPEGPLREWITRCVDVRSFNRDDPANADMSRWAEARIFFGGDPAAGVVEALPHAVGSPWFPFGNRTSEAWLSAQAAARPESALSLAKAFAIYGQAGCTSPKRAVVVGGSAEDARRLARLLEQAWPLASAGDAPPAEASEVVLGEQRARAAGFETSRLRRNSALLVLSPASAPRAFAHRGLQVQWGSLDEVVATCPANLQTVGHDEAELPDAWRAAFATTAGNRLVPLARMHDFGPVWDGVAWWRNLFRIVET